MTIKTREDIEQLRNIVIRLKNLGAPEETMKETNDWIDQEESKLKLEEGDE
ncbi:hypothetical protein LCGC14_1974420 [marine sediment metagenome]|uniref:Uncharacterized protein n=1 Tax=marine sediment metagenome TaxID=412755 RepID=A0A0F9FYY4_9ZZZZ